MAGRFNAGRLIFSRQNRPGLPPYRQPARAGLRSSCRVSVTENAIQQRQAAPSFGCTWLEQHSPSASHICSHPGLNNSVRVNRLQEQIKVLESPRDRNLSRPQSGVGTRTSQAGVFSCLKFIAVTTYVSLETSLKEKIMWT